MTQAHLESPAPDVSTSQAEQLASSWFGVRGTARTAASERDLNFLLDAPDQPAVLKISNPLVEESLISLQVAALDRLAGGPVPVPRVIPTVDGKPCKPLELADGRRAWVWMISRLPGVDAEQIQPKPRSLLIGTAVAAAGLAQRLASFDHPAARRELIWDLDQAHRLRPLLGELEDRRAADRVRRVLDQHDARVAPRLPDLRRQVIHADLNPANVLADPQSHQLTGIIDFGDLVHTALINDLAIALAYPLLETDSAEPAAIMTRAYHQALGLTPLEQELLPLRVMTRWATTVTISLWRATRHPDNRDYIMLHAQPALEALARMEKPSVFAELCEACRPTKRRGEKRRGQSKGTQ